MAKKTEPTKMVHIRARVSFMDIRRGEESVSVLDAAVQGWLDAGLVEVVDDGTVEAGPGSVEPDFLGDGA